ncbi:hypothetical protein F7725_008195 [Dissostichus mawsoni]|uniref:Uncharacterized protein n=1 Tax=Dissostichus mawsoni TaxID=36200 RepID=A0A7J5Y6H7_DISMA|nr:hypothetical protein F7725_008195 [Dissostichus mawsoni]
MIDQEQHNTKCRNKHSPLQVEAEVSDDDSTGEEGAAHAGEQVPVSPVGGAVRLRHMIGLLDHLTIYLKNRKLVLIPERAQVLAGLQDALNDGHCVRQRLHLLQGVENSHRLILQTGIALLPLDCTQTRTIEKAFWKSYLAALMSMVPFSFSSLSFS